MDIRRPRKSKRIRFERFIFGTDKSRTILTMRVYSPDVRRNKIIKVITSINKDILKDPKNIKLFEKE